MNEPFLLRPAAKDYLWGGNRLNEDFSKGISVSPLAETWECSANPDGVSTVASGRFEGMDLTSVLKCHPELLGKHHEENGVLPILVKLIDAKEELERLQTIALGLPFAQNHVIHYALFLREVPKHPEAAKIIYPDDVLAMP